MNLTKHSYVFLRKHLEESVYQVSAVSASDVLKRNTDLSLYFVSVHLMQKQQKPDIRFPQDAYAKTHNYVSSGSIEPFI